MMPSMIPLVLELARRVNLYALAHVASDVGEATVRGALEHAGLLGPNHGQLPPHRLLFCGTREGKASMVRQLEPQLHIDADAETVRRHPAGGWERVQGRRRGRQVARGVWSVCGWGSDGALHPCTSSPYPCMDSSPFKVLPLKSLRIDQTSPPQCDPPQIRQLQRFVPSLVLVGGKGVVAGGNVRHEPDLAVALGFSH